MRTTKPGHSQSIPVGACGHYDGGHACVSDADHEGDHHCHPLCGETWSQHEDDHAVLTAPVNKKKPERVRGFQI